MAKKPTKAASKPSTPTYPVNPALEAAVIANAEDDTPRLVYADWLDENGDPDRAAFIRTQVALWDKNPADAGYVDLLEQQEELGAEPELFQRLEPNLPPEVSFIQSTWLRDEAGFGYHRGFPFIARESDEPSDRTGALNLRSRLPDLFATSTIRAFNFEYAFSNYLDVILSSPASRQIAGLFLSNGVSESAPPIPVLKSVADSPAARSLRWLEISHLDLTDMNLLAQPSTNIRLRRFEAALPAATRTHITQFFASNCFSGLRRLRVRISEKEAPGTMKSIAALPELHTLESFTFGEPEVHAFATAGKFQSLGRLALHRAPLRGDGATALAKAKMPRLSVLELGRCNLRNEDVVTLANSPIFANLRFLRLADPLGDKAVSAIALSASAPDLQSLDLQGSNFGKKGLNLLATNFPNLTTLSVVSPTGKLSVEEVSAFLSELACPSLRALALNLPLSDEAAKALAQNPTLGTLTSLFIFSESDKEQTISNVGLKAIFASPHLANLTRLTLNGKSVEGAVKLLEDPAVLPRARKIQVGVSRKVGEHIERLRPGLSVR